MDQIDQTVAVDRAQLVRRGRKLEYFTIGYNSLEGIVAIIAGVCRKYRPGRFRL